MIRLGLDIGTNSIGWALIELDDETRSPLSLIDGGVVIFPDGRNPKSKVSNAAERREKRGPRRNRDRRIKGRKRLDHLLTDLGLLPVNQSDRDRVFAMPPHPLRGKAVRDPVEPYELGRIFWIMKKRRGFKSNRKTGSANEQGLVAEQASELARRIAQQGRDDPSAPATLGRYLASRHKRNKTLRARGKNGLYPLRAMIEAEFDAIRAVQAPHHPALRDEDWDEIRDTILFQRKLRPVERGHCPFEPSEDRAYRAWPLFQRFRILQDLTNLRYRLPGQSERPLSKTQFETLFLAALNKPQLKFSDMHKLVDLPEETLWNLQRGNRQAIDGDLTAKVLASKKCFGKQWRTQPLDKQQTIVEMLLDEPDEPKLIAWLTANADLPEEQARRAARANLPAGTGALGKSALQKLIPIMREQGLTFDAAVTEAGYASHSDFRLDGSRPRLPYYGEVLVHDALGADPQGRNEVERFGRIANPTVHIGLNQLRRLLNEIIDRFGKPDEIAVELARDLKQSKSRKDDAIKLSRENEARNVRLKNEMEQAGIPFSPDILRKLQLWENQGPPGKRICPYTGEPISFLQACGDETEIDHILPFSRTLDDSRANKVVVKRAANREKGNRTPYECWGGNETHYAQMRSRVDRMPRLQSWRFDPDAMERFERDSGFLSRQLNETRYLSRLARHYLSSIVPDQKIDVITGQLTAMLRGKWGLNGIPPGDANKKQRTDHRHHLVDAIVVALTNRAMLQQVAAAAESGAERGRLIAEMPDPWEGFRDDARELVERTVVFHRPKPFRPPHADDAGHTSTTGALHNDTAYGIVGGPDKKGMMTLVYRKPLSQLGYDTLDSVVDDTLKAALRSGFKAYCANAGLKLTDGKAWTGFCDKIERQGGPRRARIYETLGQSSLAIIKDKKTGQPYKAYKTDGNAFMDIWALPGSKITGEVVTRFDAHQTGFRSGVQAAHPTARKLTRLQINDMVAFGEGPEREILRVQKLSNGAITMIHHNEGGDLRQREGDKESDAHYAPLRKTPATFVKAGGRKVHVSPTGRVKDPGPIIRSGKNGTSDSGS